jgi:hypothetical protein
MAVLVEFTFIFTIVYLEKGFLSRDTAWFHLGQFWSHLYYW